MKVILSGYGKMGRMIEQILLEKGIEIVDRSEDICATDPAVAKECVCIDFTAPAAFRANYEFLAHNFKAVVVGTTGWNDIKQDVIACFEKAGTPMIYGSNYSIGVNILFKAAAYISSLAAQFPGEYAPSITEIHHIHKLDAPSGTAITLKEAYGCEMPIESVREGEVPGTHILTLGGEVDKITLSHEAFSRVGFAKGAVEAAIKVEGMSGVHDFSDIIFE